MLDDLHTCADLSVVKLPHERRRWPELRSV
jgi:hypothetical protein